MPLQFGRFTLDAAGRQLLDGLKPVRLSPKAFQLLTILVERRPSAVSKADLQKELWPSTFVVETNLANLVGELRAALKDDSKAPRFIRTVYGFGYAFSADASEGRADAAYVGGPPAQPVRRRRSVPATMAAAVVALLSLSIKSGYVEAPEPRPIDSIAVLMFQVDPKVSLKSSEPGGKDSSWLSDGVTGALINDLSTMRGVRVISRNSVASLGPGNFSATAVAKRLGVHTVMTGRIAQRDDKVVVNTELIDGDDGSLLLSRRYEAPWNDLALVESSMAQDVINRVRSGMTPEAAPSLSSETADGEAYRLRMQGQFYARRLDPESQHRAIELYAQALAHDPRYARAYSSMARAYLMLGLFFEAPRTMIPQARTLAERALQLDATLPEAHVNLGVINLLYDWDRRAAERQLITASGLRPEAIETFSCSSHLLENSGRVHDAEQEIRSALARDPLSSAVTAELGCNAYYQRHYEQAASEYRQALVLDARNVLAYYGLGRAYAQEGKYGEAAAALKKVAVVNGFVPPLIVAEIGYVYARSGQREAAEQSLQQLNTSAKKFFVDPFLYALIYTGLGDNNRAFDWLEKAYAVRSGFMPSLAGDPKFDALRRDPRFAPLQRRVGI